jgi:ribosome assembly protein RRB1
MNKRHRGSNISLQEPAFLKGGDRPVREDGEVLDFEDEYEDEFESEDEIFEAGVDGRPDAEREAEEAGMHFNLVYIQTTSY